MSWPEPDNDEGDKLAMDVIQQPLFDVEDLEAE
jgi:hypothetical protein